MNRRQRRTSPPGHRHCENECPRCGEHGEVVVDEDGSFAFADGASRSRVEAWEESGHVGELDDLKVMLFCLGCRITFPGLVTIDVAPAED